MRFSRFLLIVGVVALVSVFAMSTSFAVSANSEKLTQYKGSFSSNINKKISNIEQVYAFKNNNSKEYYKINIKKNYQNKYKIRSVNVRYAVVDNETHKIRNFLYKNYTGKNKKSLKIDILNKDDTFIDKVTINYFTKGKIKNESFYSYYYTNNFTLVNYLASGKANAKAVQKGDYKITQLGNIPIIKYQNVKIITKSKKYKIKAVKLILTNFKGTKTSYKTFKGYGKNSLKIQLYENIFIRDIKVYYY
ncbi:hypothetical protein MBBAR_5c00320 [Methanobrevibacter arboriphilus JCM 13429 = DSM 1125]|uniref:Uncharacterized protein n=1 Tax=Methanobrevibacter arboriphilus JCM 13429 = DSM 1125 TaxID=1300164 RepID=A0A1V6N3E8_METAZ|nr:hypothetical protein [Methanobrevibacter arboriphilus]OQD59189.1 hypothetical protein MBBAR_5c00320 [Methanobrevibacter arboriphilus JCM 13429 = DSM 1125]